MFFQRAKNSSPDRRVFVIFILSAGLVERLDASAAPDWPDAKGPSYKDVLLSQLKNGHLSAENVDLFGRYLANLTQVGSGLLQALSFNHLFIICDLNLAGAGQMHMQNMAQVWAFRISTLPRSFSRTPVHPYMQTPKAGSWQSQNQGGPHLKNRCRRFLVQRCDFSQANQVGSKAPTRHGLVTAG